MKSVIHKNYLERESQLNAIIYGFDASEEKILKDARNTLKLFDFGDGIINVKSFKVPNIFNQIAYQYFRKGKAQRSYEHANALIEMGIGTPEPIAYYRNSDSFLFGRSYYVSKQLKYDLTYRELINDFNYEDYDNILRAFTRFTFDLHEKGVEFLDHSPGNTLISRTNDGYMFSLVDLNRMKFGKMYFEKRMKNFARLSKYKHMVEIMSDEYAKLCSKPYEVVFEAMWKEVQQFRASINRKRNLKKKLKV